MTLGLDMASKKSLFSIKIEFSNEDLNQLFEPFDHLMAVGFNQLDELSNPVKEPFDPIDYNYLNSIKDSFLAPIIDHYFRAEIYGMEKLQKEGPAILGCNHSGTAFPYDALVLDALMWRHYHFMP